LTSDSNSVLKVGDNERIGGISLSAIRPIRWLAACQNANWSAKLIWRAGKEDPNASGLASCAAEVGTNPL